MTDELARLRLRNALVEVAMSDPEYFATKLAELRLAREARNREAGTGAPTAVPTVAAVGSSVSTSRANTHRRANP